MNRSDAGRSTELHAAFTRSRFLTREEETDLARQYRATHAAAIARRLVESHLGLVAKLARQCCSRRDMLPDLIQEGCLGLMRAVEKFDPDRGIRLGSYAAWWIRAFIYRHIMANGRMIRIATTFVQRKLYFNLNRTTARLEREGKTAFPKDIADALGVPEKAVVEMRARMAGRDVQMELTIAVDSGTPQQRLDDVSTPRQPDELVADQEHRSAVSRRLAEVAATLDARDRVIFDERLTAEIPTTLNAIGARFGISRERARQLEQRLKTRLRPLFREFREDDGADEVPTLAA